MLANHALNIYGNALEGLIIFRYACILVWTLWLQSNYYIYTSFQYIDITFIFLFSLTRKLLIKSAFYFCISRIYFYNMTAVLPSDIRLHMFLLFLLYLSTLEVFLPLNLNVKV